MGNAIFSLQHQRERPNQANDMQQRDRDAPLWREEMAQLQEQAIKYKEHIVHVSNILQRIQANDATLTSIKFENVQVYSTTESIHVAVWDALVHYQNYVTELRFEETSEESASPELDRVFGGLLDRFAHMRSIQTLSIGLMGSLELKQVCQAVRAHGNLVSVDLKCCILDQEGALENVAAALVPETFTGLQQVYFTIQISDEIQDDDWISNFCNGCMTAFGSGLKENETIQVVGLNPRLTMSHGTFRDFATRILPTMPSLTTFDMQRVFVPDREISKEAVKCFGEYLLTSVQQSKTLRQVHWLPLDDPRGEEAAAVQEIEQLCAYRREWYRVDLPRLLTSTTIPCSLWPLILNRTRQIDVFYELLCEKNDVVMVNLRK